MKQRMASADVAGEVAYLKQKILGMRLANLYDLNAKTYVLKLSKSGSDGEKVFLLLESGTRFHTVQVMYDKPDAPSNFTLKLRKHLRTRRVEDVRQLGVDRVVDFQFGCGETAHHLILEMYAQGNVILTDHTYSVLTLLRSHRDDDKGTSTMARHPYPMHAIRLRQPLALDTLRAALAAAAAAGPAVAAAGDAAGSATLAAAGDGEADGQASGGEDDDAAAAAAAAADKQQQQQPAANGKQGKKSGWKAGGGKGAQGPVLKAVLADLFPYGPAVAQHCCQSAGLQPQHALAAAPLSDAQVLALHGAVQRFEAWLAALDAGSVAEGFIAAVSAVGAGKQQQQAQQQQQQQQEPPAAGEPGSKEGGSKIGGALVYQDYNPLQLAQGQGPSKGEVLAFPTFDEALDEYYSKIQGQRVEVAKLDAERAALSRLDKIRLDQGARSTALLAEAGASEERAAMIEYNLEAVDAAIDAVNAAIATGMDWRELEALIKEERRSGNPVAGAIHSLQLDQNRITLLLSNLLDAEEEDEAALTRPATKVQVDLGMSAYSNAAAHHAVRKKQQAKQEKTLAAHAEAFKAAEKKAAAQLANLRNAGPAATVVRKPAWFERFHWFISSENYLIISGHDAQQNELIVKRYFRKDDVYVHAELHGASSTIVRNHDPSRPVPPITLQQAGCACVCRSKAWDAKLVTSAWWVHHHQVSKTAPTGEYLPTGSFMIRGKKNFLPPQGLVMGFGFMFKLEDGCIGRHAGERAVRGGLEEEGDEEAEEQQQRSAARQQQAGAGADPGDDDGDAGSSSAADLSAAPSSATSALDAFLDMSADQLAAAGRRPSASSSSAAVPRAGFERYGLQHPAAAAAAAADEGEGDEADEGAAQLGAGVKGDSRRYVTAAERARLKKAAAKAGSSSGQQQQTQQQQQQQRQQQQATGGAGKAGGVGGKPPAGPSAAAAAASAAAAAAGAGKGQRGKKAKAAKAKEKYAEQDEEDRELALQLLGSAGAKKSRQDRRSARKAAREEARHARDGLLVGPVGGGQHSRQEAIARATGSQFKDLAAAPGPEGDDGGSSSGSASGEDAQQQQQQQQGAGGGSTNGGVPPESQQAQAAATAAAADGGDAASESSGDDEDDAAGAALAAAADEAERAEISALLAEENVAEVLYEGSSDAAAAALRELDSLTGCPRPDDTLLFAVPVCGPYAALAAFKLKVKLTPGTLKKGKATKQAIELLVRGGDVAPRERDLMRAVALPEAVAVMAGTVKISAAGLQQLKQTTKKAKKQAAKKQAQLQSSA